jgi:hypothetical protein
MHKVIERMLPCKLTQLEIHEKIKKLRVKMDELREIHTREKSYKDEIKEAKKEVEPDIGILTKEISEESELRTVKCAVMYDSETFDCYTVRLDTGEQVGKPRRMTQEEIDEQTKIDLVKESEKSQADEQPKASAAPGSVAPTEGEQGGAAAQPGDIAADGAEPANLEDGQEAEGEAQTLPVNGDPDGWLESAEGAQEAGQAAKGDAPAPTGEEAAKAPQDAQEGPSQADLDEWGDIEFPAGQPAGEGAQEKAAE